MSDAVAVREEDAFDVAAVVAWLAAQGVEVGELEVQQFPGGASNLTYALGEDLILRRPPTGRKAKGAHDMGREFRIQAALAEPFGLVPPMVAFCEDESVIGSPFYVMGRVDGITPRRELGVDLDAEAVRTLCENTLEVLVRLHGVDAAASPELSALNKGSGYVRRQIEGWSTRWRQAVTDDVDEERAARAERVMGWLDEHQPADVAQCVIHNDFRFDNLVLDRADPTRVLAVFDWELATVGDPLMDLGCTLAYWVQADDDPWFEQFRRQPTHLPGMLTRDELVTGYAERTGREIPDRDRAFYEAYGAFRLAGISQQIYYRYFHGQTHNEAYARFGPAAAALEARAADMLGV
ncbi:phosphotransferase family protein [Nocardioides mangrovicus]|uniref:Phosphotransferase family protein n=1 Tax=Nocardioides mangrovicus TaxID=2478913 RepID=A0A3L8NYZ8_9ACTN|nr:phosphotransferase family protein [Nocardioides mangrovicus]RLV48001.1 phosphotransferase family protein [Nocardioides mangrovicus]